MILMVHAKLWGQDVCTRSTEGTDFWFGFMENRNDRRDRYVEVTVTARKATTFRITAGNKPFGTVYTVDPLQPQQVKIPWEIAEASGSEVVQNKGINLISEAPVNVYALNWDINSADVAVIYPVGSLGTQYFAMCYYPDIDPANPFTGNGRNSEFLIVATENNTRIEITPSKVTHFKKPAYEPFTVTLNKGQVYQVQSENMWGSDEEGQGDLTGSFIHADKPVAFYSGALATRIPNNVCCWDHLYEQIPPLHSWGREYFTIPLRSRRGDRYRIMAAENNTTINVTDNKPVTIGKGEFLELVISDKPKRILSDKPVMVAQFSQSTGVDSIYTDRNGDPFMIILSATNQSKNNVTFVAYDSESIQFYFVNIITPTSEVPGITFDGEPIPDDFIPVPGYEEYSYAQKKITAGPHHLSGASEGEGFLAYVYGFGGVESYGYGVGFNLDLVLDLGESVYFNGDTLLLCKGDTLILDAGSYFDSYTWNTGENNSRIAVTEEGTYRVSTTTADGCNLMDEVYVHVSDPNIDLEYNSGEECAPFSLKLDADEGYSQYLWQDGHGDTLSVNRSFTISETGLYKATVTDQYQCRTSDSISLVVHPVPQTEIDNTILICGEQKAIVNMEIGGAPDSIWNYNNNYSWFTNEPTGINFSDQTINQSTVNVNDWGSFTLYHRLTTIDNCVITDTIIASFYPTPSAEFQFIDNAADICSGYSRELTYTGNARPGSEFSWNFGGSMVLDTLGKNHFRISLGISGSNPIAQLVVNDNGCLSDKISFPIGSKPEFTMLADTRRGCDSLLANFSGNLLLPGSMTYEWNLGDGPDIIHEQNPSHFYADTGFYTVSLKVTNQADGCAAGFEIDSMIKVFPTPVADISALETICYNDTISLLYTGSIDSTYAHWGFEGMHRIGGENDSIVVVLDQSFSTVKLMVDEYGCYSDTLSRTLKRKPDFDFETESTVGCAPYHAIINAVAFDNELSFQWMTDSLPWPSEESITFDYPDAGEYQVGLVAGSGQTGCYDTLIRTGWIEVHPRPEANFWVNYPVALIERSTIQFNNTSRMAKAYYWDFGDGESSVEPNPSHSYNTIDEYLSTLVAENEFGCTDTATFRILILPGQTFAPNAFRPDSPIEVNRTFMPVGLNAYQLNFNLRIFDRWGQLVYETTSTNKPWDGKSRTGIEAPMGNYIWIARYIDVQGFEHEQKGQVLLVR